MIRVGFPLVLGLGLILTASALLAGCSLMPTKIIESSAERGELRDGESLLGRQDILVERSQRALVLGEETIVVDVRSALDHSLARLARSVHLRLADLQGQNSRELQEVTRHLALKGLGPDSEVIVVGYGPRGQGEEGAVALRLYQLGLRDIQVASVDLFRRQLRAERFDVVENHPPWRAELETHLVAETWELEQTQMEPDVHLIDVREERDFLRSRDREAVNVPWSEFFTPQGRPNLELRDRLEAIGIGRRDRIVVVGDLQRGGEDLRPQAATMALLSLGFQRPAYYHSSVAK